MCNTITLSLIIPIQVTFSNRFLLKRVRKLVDFFSNYNNVEIVLIDSSHTERYTQAIKNLSEYDAVLYQHLDISTLYSASMARNQGAKIANGKYILFYDVDLIVDNDFVPNIMDDINNLKQEDVESFKIYPCFYLSEIKTKMIEKENYQNIQYENILKHYLEGFNDEVLYLAVNTSTILVSKKHFFNIGGYNEVFQGHGYEDFELIHKLYKYMLNTELPKDYIDDYKTPFPALYRGFRQYFAYLSLPNLFKDSYTMHLWHPRPLSKKYYRNREQNFKEFKKIIEKDINLDHTNSMNNEYKKFIIELLKSNGYDDIEKYCGFFRLNDYALAKQTNSSFIRKIRKFIFNPKLFFRDMFKINLLKRKEK